MRLSRIAVFLPMFLPVACGTADFAPVYRIAAIEAKAADSDTGQPIEGANVVAVYETSRAGFSGRLRGTVLEVMETATDAQGRFAFPAVTLVNSSVSESLQSSDPAVLIFKPRYVPREFRGNRDPRYGINGQSVKMTRYSEEQLANPKTSFYRGADSFLDSVIQSCKWDRIPKTILAMTAEEERVRAANPGALVSLPTVTVLQGWSEGPRPICRSAAEFFRSYSE